MTAYRYCTIMCDYDEPPTGPCGEESPFEPTVSLARRLAKETGWVRRGKKDYCPYHADAHRAHTKADQ